MSLSECCPTALQGGQGQGNQPAVSLKQALQELQNKQTAQQSPPTTAAPRQQATTENAIDPVPAEEPPAGDSTAENGSRLLLGFATSEPPRGVLGRGAPGVCLAPLLHAQRALQKAAGQGGGVLVAFNSPSSSVLRVAEARSTIGC